MIPEGFDLGDVVTSAFTLFNVFTTPFVINNGAGLLADNGSRQVAFFPDGGFGTPLDGDAALSFMRIENGFIVEFAVHPVRWVAVAEPGTMNGMVPLFGPRNPLRNPALLKVGP